MGDWTGGGRGMGSLQKSEGGLVRRFLGGEGGGTYI